MNIRQSTEVDRDAINALHVNAFGPDEGVEITRLVDGLLQDATAKPLLSLVAEVDGILAGHILFTAVTIQSEPNVAAQILAPLGVASDFQGAGIGGALINEGLQRLAASGVQLVFVLGHPGYYPRYGFRTAGAVGFEAPYFIAPEHADAWMVQELEAGVTIGRVKGLVRCATTLDDPRYWQE